MITNNAIMTSSFPRADRSTGTRESAALSCLILIPNGTWVPGIYKTCRGTVIHGDV